MSTDPMSSINSAGGSYAKFGQPGDTVTGTVAEFTFDHNYTSYDGNPNPCTVVVLDVDGELEPVRMPLDNGRKLYAVKQALRTANAERVEVGGTLALRYSHDGDAQRGQNPPKMFTAQYAAPNPTVAAANDAVNAAEAPFTAPAAPTDLF
ncbi:MAG: hypothetical protein GY925_19505 [Actinomycetia bacterium]|nr:hypothetical protein [Actinomycetes bacterium]